MERVRLALELTLDVTSRVPRAWPLMQRFGVHLLARPFANTTQASGPRDYSVRSLVSLN